MNNFTCRYLSDFTDEALSPLDDIEYDLTGIESILNHKESYDDYEYFKSDILVEIIDIRKYIKEIKVRF